MIRKIMVMVAVAATVVLTSQGVQAQERRQVMLDRVVAVVGGKLWTIF